MGEHTMTTNHDDDSVFDDALRAQLQAGDEPDDAGFSLRVMSALPAARVSARQKRWARWVRRAQWLAISLAACGVAALLGGNGGSVEGPQALAALALMGLLIYWAIPSRWNRG
jgi:hypothetical protein